MLARVRYAAVVAVIEMRFIRPATRIIVRYGVYSMEAEPQTIGELRVAVPHEKVGWRMPSGVIAFCDGQRVGNTYVPDPGSVVDFVHPASPAARRAMILPSIP